MSTNEVAHFFMEIVFACNAFTCLHYLTHTKSIQNVTQCKL